MQIYIHRNNQQLGPYNEEQVKALIATGSISLQDHAWWQGQATWLPLAQTPFAGGLSSAAPLPSSTAPPLPPSGTGVGPHWLPHRTSSFAVWSMVCGILSLFSCGLASIPAIILGHMGLSETRNPNVQGRGMAWSGLIMGYALIAFFLLVFLVSFGAFGILGYQVNNTFKALNAQIRAAQLQNSDDDSDSSTNSADQSTNNGASSNDSSTNAAPNVTP
jgi:hypothetical protein